MRPAGTVALFSRMAHLRDRSVWRSGENPRSSPRCTKFRHFLLGKVPSATSSLRLPHPFLMPPPSIVVELTFKTADNLPKMQFLTLSPQPRNPFESTKFERLASLRLDDKVLLFNALSLFDREDYEQIMMMKSNIFQFHL